MSDFLHDDLTYVCDDERNEFSQLVQVLHNLSLGDEGRLRPCKGYEYECLLERAMFLYNKNYDLRDKFEAMKEMELLKMMREEAERRRVESLEGFYKKLKRIKDAHK